MNIVGEKGGDGPGYGIRSEWWGLFGYVRDCGGSGVLCGLLVVSRFGASLGQGTSKVGVRVRPQFAHYGIFSAVITKPAYKPNACCGDAESQ